MKNDIYIISSKNKWGVYKYHSNRATRTFKYRDLAFHYAAGKFNQRIIVFDNMGNVDFTYNDKKL